MFYVLYRSLGSFVFHCVTVRAWHAQLKRCLTWRDLVTRLIFTDVSQFSFALSSPLSSFQYFPSHPLPFTGNYYTESALLDCEGRKFCQRPKDDASKEPVVSGKHGAEDRTVVREHQSHQSGVLREHVLTSVAGASVSAWRISGPERLQPLYMSGRLCWPILRCTRSTNLRSVLFVISQLSVLLSYLKN